MSTKIDKTQIRNTDGTVSEWLTLIDHPTVVALSASIDNHLTDTLAISGGESVGVGDMMVLNNNGTVAKAGKKPSTVSPYINTGSCASGQEKYFAMVYSPTYDIFLASKSLRPPYVTSVVQLSGDTWIKKTTDITTPSSGEYGNCFNAYDTENDILVTFVREPSGGYANILRAYVGTVSMSGDINTVDIEYSTLSSPIGLNGWPGNAYQTYNQGAMYNAIDKKIIVAWMGNSAGGPLYLGLCTVTATGAPSAAYFTYESQLDIGEEADWCYDETNNQYIVVGEDNTFVVSISGDSLVIDDTIANPPLLDVYIFSSDCTVAGNKIVNIRSGIDIGTVSAGTMTWDYHQDWGRATNRIKLAYDPVYEKVLATYDAGSDLGGSSMTILDDEVLLDDEEIVMTIFDPYANAIEYNDVHQRIILCWQPSGLFFAWYKFSDGNVDPNSFYGIYQGVEHTTDLFVSDIFLTDTVGWSTYVNNILETLPGENGVSITYVDSSNGGLLYFREVLGTLGALTSDLIVGEEYIVSGYVKVITTGYVRCDFNNIFMEVDGNTLLSNAEWLPFDDYIFTATTATGHTLFVSSMGTGEVFYIKDLKISPTAHRIGRNCFMDSNQSGLTINTNYYIDDLGRLTTDSTKPYVGKAVSDTEIIIKG